MASFNLYYGDALNRRPLTVLEPGINYFNLFCICCRLYLLWGFSLKLGTPCVVQHDHNFYRGIVRELCPDGQLLIQYVDYGTEMKLPTERLSEISDEFMKKAVFAVPSSFHAFKMRGRWTKVESGVF